MIDVDRHTPVAELDAGGEALVRRLVELHGETGVCPTADDWRAILAIDDGPVHLLNLLAFTATVQTPDGPRSGADAYRRYAGGVGGAFQRVGGQQVFSGEVGHLFGFGDLGRWETAVLSRYPSSRAVADMWLDPEFVAAHGNRVDGVAWSEVLVFAQ